MKNINTISVIISLAVAAFSSIAAPPPHHHAPMRHNQPPHRHPQSRNANIWRAFSMLSEPEQRELMKLQRTDPDKFREVMQKKAAEINAERQTNRAKVQQLAEQIRSCKDEKQKAALQQQLRNMVKRNFEQRLSIMRRNIEANKKRLAAMEKELKKREENSSAVIDAITDSIISGKLPPRPGARPRPPKPQPPQKK